MSETEICIVDTPDSNERDEANCRLIWTACLFSEKSSASSYPASGMDIAIAYDTMPEGIKFRQYMNLMARNPDSKQEVLDSIELQYKNMLLYRKQKGKNQEQIVWLKRAEKDIEQRFEVYKEWFVKGIEPLNLTALLPISCIDIDLHDKPLLLWWLPPNNSLKNGQALVKFYASAMPDNQTLLLVDASVRQYATFMEIGKPAIASAEKPVLCHHLFDFPEPISLTSQQVQAVRNDLSATAVKLMDQLASLNKEVMTISFTENNFLQLSALAEESTGELKKQVQQAIYVNTYLNRIKTETTKTYKLWMGITSFYTLFEFYRLQGVIDLSAEAYSKEETARMVELGNARVFLFLEYIENP
jgi:hypothetical protein